MSKEGITFLKQNQFVPIALLALITWFAFANNDTQKTHSYQVVEVGIQNAKSFIENGAIIIDVRGKEAFDKRHIPGAILLPIAVLRAGIPKYLESAIDKPIVVYCNKGKLKGPEGAHILTKAGFSNAVSLKPGIEGWAASGMQVKTS